MLFDQILVKNFCQTRKLENSTSFEPIFLNQKNSNSKTVKFWNPKNSNLNTKEATKLEPEEI